MQSFDSCEGSGPLARGRGNRLMIILISSLVLLVRTEDPVPKCEAEDSSTQEIIIAAQQQAQQDLTKLLAPPLNEHEKQRLSRDWQFQKAAMGGVSLSLYKKIEVGPRCRRLDELETFRDQVGITLIKLDRLPNANDWELVDATGRDLYWKYHGMTVTERRHRDEFSSLVDERLKLVTALHQWETSSDFRRWTIREHRLGPDAGTRSWEFEGIDLGPTYDPGEFLKMLEYQTRISARLRSLSQIDPEDLKMSIRRYQFGENAGKISWQKDNQQYGPAVELKEFETLIEWREKKLKVTNEE